jgi:hypothetical protein
MWGLDISVGSATGYGMSDLGIVFHFPAVAINFYLFLSVQTGSGTHPAFSLMITRGSFPGEVIEAGA